MENGVKKVKLLVATGIYPPDIGGPATYSVLLEKELPAHNIEVEVLSFGSIRYLPKVVRHVAYFVLLLIRGFKADVIYAQDPISVGLPALLVTNILNTRFLIRLGGDYAWEQGKARFGVTDNLDDFSKKKEGYHTMVRFLKFVEKKVVDGADVVVVPSNYLKGIISNWGVDPKKIVVIYTVVEAPKDVAEKEVLRKLMQLNGKVMISVGRLVPWKGIDLIINLMPKLLKKIPDLTYIVVGDGVEREKLETLVTKLGLESNVRFTGALDNPTTLRYMKASDLYVLNTGYEGLPHQVQECHMLGTPVITTTIGGNVEVIQSGKNGILVSYNDTDQFEKEIVKMLTDELHRNEIIKKGLQKPAHFTKEYMLDSIAQIIKI